MSTERRGKVLFLTRPHPSSSNITDWAEWVINDALDLSVSIMEVGRIPKPATPGSEFTDPLRISCRAPQLILVWDDADLMRIPLYPRHSEGQPGNYTRLTTPKIFVERREFSNLSGTLQGRSRTLLLMKMRMALAGV